MIRRISWPLRLCFGLLIGLGLGVSAGGTSPAIPQADLVFIPPGNPIEFAVATCDGWPTFQDHLDAVQMAMHEHGPIKGFTLQCNDYGTLCDPDSGAIAAGAIVADEQNVGVIGPLYSSSTVGAAPVFETSGVVMISYANTWSDLPTFGPNIFNRTIIPDPSAEAWAARINSLPSAVAWRADFQAEYGRAPDPYALLAYDAAALLLARIEEVSVLDGGGNLVIDRAALAAAVRNTANWSGASGLVSLEVNGDRVNDDTTVVWADQFSGPSLSPRWSWIDQDPVHWSLTDNPGFLRLITQQEDRNRLVQDAPPGDFEMRTRLLFTPTENYQIAGLYVYGDEGNYLKLGRAHCDIPPPICAGNGIYFDHIEGGTGVGSNYVMTTAVEDEAYLRIVRVGSDFSGYLSTNGTEWALVGTHTIGFTPAKIGLTASNQGQPVGEIPADFDFFVLEDRLPQTTLTLAPVADAYVDSFFFDGNFGADHFLEVVLWDSGEVSSRAISLLRFDLAAALPTDAILDSAWLELYLLPGAGGANPIDLEVARVIEPWQELVVTYDNQPDVGEPVVTTQLAYSDPAYYGLDVARIVQAWREGSNDGLQVAGPFDVQHSLSFASRENVEWPPLLVVTYHQPTPAELLVVNTTADEDGACTAGFCTLRQAIRAANERPGPDRITFNIPPGDPGYDPDARQWIIDLNGESLPVTGDDTVLDATTQPAPGREAASNASACPELYLQINAAGSPYGFDITAAGVELTGFAITNAQAHGVRIAGGAHDNILTCNNILNNTQDGVRIEGGATGNLVGSDDGSLGNLISGNGSDGVEIAGSGTSGNRIAGNRIGTDETGMQAWANGAYGVRIGNGATENQVGLAQAGSGNLISGNSAGGVFVIGYDTVGNVVQNNHIGINGEGSHPLPNGDGVVIRTAVQNTIGPANLISGNLKDGVRLETAATGNVVKGNTIGTDQTGSLMVSNRRFGIQVSSESNNNIIGGDTPADGNLISGNGYEEDYARRGGVGILGGTAHNILRNNLIGTDASGRAPIPNALHGVLLTDNAQENSIGQDTYLKYANTIAHNLGDGIRIDGSGSVRNTIGRNIIHDNEGLGINNENGGNQNLDPPELLSYYTDSGGNVTLTARTCPGCAVLVYSDDGGEGQHYEGHSAGHPTSGHFDWSGNPIGSAYTLVATDADGNTSEFSAGWVLLELAVDDALPHIVVNKVPGDAAGPAGSTTVEYEATITSYDPSLHDGFDLEVGFSSTILGTPVRVFSRAQDADYDGVPINWSSPSPGVFRVEDIDLQPGPSPDTWVRRVILRFALPDGTAPTGLSTVGSITAQGRAVSDDSDSASLQILRRADEIIITNRAVLYREYGDGTTSFLQDLYELGQGPPYNWSPSSVIYYVDTYLPGLAAWDNTQVNYGTDATANAAALQVDSLIEDWVEDSTTEYKPKCFLQIFPFGWKCVPDPVDFPHDLLIAGDDNIIPFYRLTDPADDESNIPIGGNVVLAALTLNNRIFTDNYYADLSYVLDDFEWQPGGVELATGRLIGMNPASMSTLMTSGRYGPDQQCPARAIVASGCLIDAGEIPGVMMDYGYDVLNDDETPCTVDNDNWQRADLLTLLQGDYQLLYHGNHANEGCWSAPPCDDLQCIDIADVLSAAVTNRLQANHPILTSSGCRSGLSGAATGQDTTATAMASNGASAVMAPTGISHSCFGGRGKMCSGEDFMVEFWKAAANYPYTLNMGEALALNKRTWDGHFSVDDHEQKMGAHFTLYGIPWVTAPYRGAQPLSAKALEPPAGAGRLTAPVRVAQQSYVVEATFDASEYQVKHQDGFDFVEVAGMPLAHDTDVPIAPLAEAELTLPFDGQVTGTEVVRTNPVSLGALNIPMVEPGEPIPGGDRGGPREVPPDAGIFPPQLAASRSVGLEGYRLGRVYATPLTYDPATDQATLYRNLTVRITYVLSSTIAALSLEADPADPAPDQPFLVRAQVLNASDEPVLVTGTLTLESSLGPSALQGRQAPSVVVGLGPFAVFPGAPYRLEVPWVAPSAEGPYSLLLELWQGGTKQVMTTSRLTVSGGWIAGLSAPDRLHPGQAAAVAVTFANRRAEEFSGLAAFSIYTADGLPVAKLEPVPLAAEPGQEGTAGAVWDTTGRQAGPYVVTVEVTDEEGAVSYGVAQKSFWLRRLTYLPWVRRSR